jgi:hypothetical protein
MITEGMTAEAILQEANSLAAAFHFALGFSVPDGYQFHRSPNPRAKFSWQMACIAFERINATDLAEIVAEVEESTTSIREASNEP